MTHKLVLIRHGESQWNLENRFTGWTDVDLTDNGRQEAIRAGQLLKQEGYDFDLCYTSVLRRAIGTLWTVLGEMDRMWLPVTHSWRLNERHYGNLQGWNKAETAEKYGEDQVKIWRRAYAIAPPPLAEDDPRLVEQLNNPRYANVPRAELPRTECLKDTVARVLPFWNETIAPSIKSGKRVIIAAHGNSLRALVKHLDGICHVYIDDSADVDMAVRVADNAKTQRYAPCNTLETLLVHEAIAPDVLPRLGSIYRMKQVELRVDEHGARLLQEAQIDSVPATEDDWRTEYLAPILAIRVVKSLDEAIAHINEYGSHHTDSIITQNHAHGMRFLREVDSASVMINASTRFADGFEYGLGAEIGISTDKLHARGPVGLEGLTSQKYVVFGHGEIRT